MIEIRYPFSLRNLVISASLLRLLTVVAILTISTLLSLAFNGNRLDIVLILSLVSKISEAFTNTEISKFVGIDNEFKKDSLLNANGPKNLFRLGFCLKPISQIFIKFVLQALK